MENNKAIQFFKNMMSPGKTIRTQAESHFEQIKSYPFKESFPIFQEGIKSTDKKICQFATLMMKKMYLDNNEIIDKYINDLETIKNFILSQITFNNQDWDTLKRFGEVLAMIYQRRKENNYNFEEIMQIFNKNDILARKLALFIISNLSELGVINDNFVKQNGNDFIQIFKVTMEDKADEVKSSAIIAFNKFIVNLKEENVQGAFSILINPLLQNILSLFKEKVELEKEIFDSLIFLADSYPKFFINNLNEIIEFVCKIASEIKIDFRLRISSLEIIYTLAHSIPAKIRENQTFVKIFIPLIFNLILDIDNIDSTENWNKLKEEDENELEFMFYHIKSGLERISMDLGGQYFMKTIDNYIQNYLKSNNWVEIHGGFATLAFISESAKDIFSEKLKDLLQYISLGLIHEHPRVRYMALTFLGNLLTETAPKPQKEYVHNILPAIARLLKDEKLLRVKSMACLTLNNFFAGLISKNKNVEKNVELLKPYINDLVDFILNILEQSIKDNYEPLQKNSLECISLLSSIEEKHFEEYYPKIMLGLKKLYYKLNTETAEQKQLRTNCINTIGYLFSGISEDYDKYKDDFIELSKDFIKVLEDLPVEDPQIIAIIEAFINISLGIYFPDFKDIFKKLFSFFEKYISADIGLTLQDAEVDKYVPNEEQPKGVGSVIFNFGVKSKKISVNTFALQLKITSLEALNEIALNLGENFKDYYEKYLNLVRNLLTFAYSRKIRKISIKGIFTCSNACSTDEERKKVFDLIIVDLINLLEFDIEAGFFKDMKCIIKYIGKSLSLFESDMNIDNDRIKKIFEVLYKVLLKVKTKITNLYDLFKNDKDGIYDANDKSDQNSDILQLQKIYQYINILFQGFHLLDNNTFTDCGKYLLNFYSELWKEEQKYLVENNSINEQKSKEVHENSLIMCIHFYNVFMEYSDEQSFRDLSVDFFSKTQEICKLQIGENIIGYILDGYGIICQRQDNILFKEKFNTIINFIENILNRAESKNQISHDKAVRALGKYIYYKVDNNLNLNQEDNEEFNEEYKCNITNKFLNFLPVTNDLEISDKICSELFDQINEEKCQLLLKDKIEEETKKAINRIIELNSKENFIEDLTKLLKCSLSLGLNFSHLVD